MLGSHGIWNKAVYYERSMTVPLLLQGPGIAAGAREIRSPISRVDLSPTVSGLCGLLLPADVDGYDFSGLLRGGGARSTAAFAPTASPRRSVAFSTYVKYGGRVAGHAAGERELMAGSHAAMRVARSERWK